MATDLERLTVMLSADIKSLENGMKRAQAATNRQLRAIEQRHQQSAGKLKQIWANAATSFGGLGGRAVGGLAAGLAGALAVGEITKAADAYTNLGNRLRALGIEGEKTARTQNEVVQIAMRSGAALDSVGQLYTRLLSTTRDLGVSQAEVGRATEIISKGFAISGASASEAASASTQLSQSFASGVLRGEEFNAIMENAQPLAQAIAKEFGVTTGQLRAMAEAGEIVSSRVFAAIIKSGPEIERAYSTSIPTVERSLGNLGTAFAALVGKMDQSIGLSQRVAGAFTAMANSINSISISDPLKDAVESLRLLQAQQKSGVTGAGRLGGAPTDLFGGATPAGRLGSGTSIQTRIDAQAATVEKLVIQRIDDVAQAAIKAYGGGEQAGLEFGEGISAPGVPLPPTRPADLGKGGSKAAVQTYKDVQQAANERIAQLKVEQATLGMTTAAAESFRLEQELLAQAQQEGITLTAREIEDLRAKAAAYGEIAAQIETTRDKQQEAQQAIQQAQGLTQDFFGGIGSDILSGASAVDALKDAFGRLEKQLIDMALNALIQKLFTTLLGAPTGPTNIIGGAGPMAVPTFKAAGGPVHGPGTGTSDSIPARLSAGEYVVKASQAAQNRTLLDAINYGTGRVMKMAGGGPVGGSSGGSSKVQPIINVTNNNSGADVQAHSRDDGTTEIIIGTVQQGMAQGRFNPTMRGTWGLGNNRVRRGSA